MSNVKFSVAERAEHLEAAHADRTAVAQPSHLAPLQAYLGLKSLFGEPNREDLDEENMQWVFFIKTEDALIEVNDWKMDSCSIHVYERNKDEVRAKHLIAELERQIEKASESSRGVVSKLRKTPLGHFIENPFSHYYGTAQELLDIAEQLQIAHLTPSGSAHSLSGLSVSKTLCRTAFFQLIAAIEALMNLVYELYLKADLGEERIIKRLGRDDIDVKIRLAPIYCDCFVDTPIDHKTEAFRKFSQLINARNDFIHANFTKSMKTPIVSYDDVTFTIQEDAGNIVIPKSMSGLDIEQVKNMRSVIDDIVEQVVRHMKARDQRMFRSVMNDQLIAVEYDENDVPAMRPLQI